MPLRDTINDGKGAFLLADREAVDKALLTMNREDPHILLRLAAMMVLPGKRYLNKRRV